MFFALRAFVGQRVCRSSGILRYSTRSARSILDDDSTPVDLSEDNDAVNGVRARNSNKPSTPERTPAEWKAHRASLKEAFPAGWNPPRKLSREAMDGLRQLHRVDPETFTTPVLAERFRVSPEAVRRILKSQWTPPPERRTKMIKKATEAKAQFLSLSALKERMEARRVMESRMDMRAARRNDGLEFDNEEDAEPEEEGGGHRNWPMRGIHPRDKLTFE
ncbi:Neugrin-domain-containing protein [Mycena galopus ATCC 62051]|nr:Neugrin-domain-containing protein [Mycena galopus ATCC 62051]